MDVKDLSDLLIKEIGGSYLSESKDESGVIRSFEGKRITPEAERPLIEAPRVIRNKCVTIRLTGAERETLECIAKLKKSSVSDLIRLAIASWAEHLGL